MGTQKKNDTDHNSEQSRAERSPRAVRAHRTPNPSMFSEHLILYGVTKEGEHIEVERLSKYDAVQGKRFTFNHPAMKEQD